MNQCHELTVYNYYIDINKLGNIVKFEPIVLNL